MMNYYELFLEVPGHIGPRSVLDREARPPVVSSLHFVFEGWGGDELLTSFPVYLVTESLAATFSTEGFSGFELGPVEIEKGKQILTLQPNSELPDFLWFKVTGAHSESDFFITKNRYLGVSERVLDVILETDPETLMYRPYEEGNDSGEWQ